VFAQTTFANKIKLTSQEISIPASALLSSPESNISKDSSIVKLKVDIFKKDLNLSEVKSQSLRRLDGAFNKIYQSYGKSFNQFLINADEEAQKIIKKQNREEIKKKFELYKGLNNPFIKGVFSIDQGYFLIWGANGGNFQDMLFLRKDQEFYKMSKIKIKDMNAFLAIKTYIDYAPFVLQKPTVQDNKNTISKNSELKINLSQDSHYLFIWYRTPQGYFEKKLIKSPDQLQKKWNFIFDPNIIYREEKPKKIYMVETNFPLLTFSEKLKKQSYKLQVSQ
jgi:hypothetical protein